MTREELVRIAKYVFYDTHENMTEATIPQTMLPSVQAYLNERLGVQFEDISFEHIDNAEEIMLDFLTSDKCSYTDLVLFLNSYLVYQEDELPYDLDYDLTKEVGLSEEMLNYMNVDKKYNIIDKRTGETVAVGFRETCLDLVDIEVYETSDYEDLERIDDCRTLIIGDQIIADAVSKTFFNHSIVYLIDKN